MWEQARKNERQIKHLMNEHRKKFERRKDQLDKNRRKPCELLHLYGVKAQIHLNSSLTSQAENCLIPWTGDSSNGTTIDRFDARAHLDTLPSDSVSSASDQPSKSNESYLNYLRYKDLIQCEFLDIPEDKRLEQEIFIPHAVSGSDESDSDGESNNPMHCDMSSERLHFLNAISQRYMIEKDDFIKYLREDKKEKERIRSARKAENEKSILSSSKSKKDRHLPRERSVHIEVDKSNSNEIPSRRHSSSSSSSSSDDDTKVNRKKEFIHSIGGSSDEEDTKRVKKEDNRDKNRSRATSSVTHVDRVHNSHRRRHSSSRSRSRSSDRRRDSRRRSYRETSRDRERYRDRKYRDDRDHGDRRRSDRQERYRDTERDLRLRNLRGKRRDEDEFGREKRKRAASPVVEKRKEVIKKVVDDTPEEKEVKTLPPPPPTVKRYYRPELEKESDASSHSSDDEGANAQ